MREGGRVVGRGGGREGGKRGVREGGRVVGREGRKGEGIEREWSEREMAGVRGVEEVIPIHFQWSILSLNSTMGRKKGRGSNEDTAPTSAER